MRKHLTVVGLTAGVALAAVGLAGGLAQATDDCVIVVDQEARHYSWTGGPLADGVIPLPPPGGDWQANTHQEPHLNNPNVTWVGLEGIGLHYTSHGSSGLADWFFFQPEVSHEECDPPDTTVPPTTTDCVEGPIEPDGYMGCLPCDDPSGCVPPCDEIPDGCQPPPCYDPLCEPPPPPPPACEERPGSDGDCNTDDPPAPLTAPDGPVRAAPAQTG
jgi:hypothetical protein